MDLKSFLSPLSADAREEFATKCGTSKGHLQNVMYGVRPCAPELAVLIEKHSGGEVTRPDLRTDWEAIWPELAAPTPATPRSPTNHPSQRATDKPCANAGTSRKTPTDKKAA